MSVPFVLALPRPWAGAARLLLIGSLALAAGFVLYASDRHPAQGPWMPATMALFHGPHFGALGGWLPSALHSFAFSLYTAAALRPRAAPAYGACAAWGTVNLVFEAAQHPTLALRVGAGLRALTADTPALQAPARALAGHLQAGRFDPGDLVAATLGACAAAALLWALHPKAPHDGR